MGSTGLVIVAFLAIFLLIASGGLLLFYREAMLERIAKAIAPNEKPKETDFRSTLQQTGSNLGGVVGQFEKVLPKSAAETSVAQQRLIRAGYRDDAAIKLLYGTKALVPITLCLVVFLSGLAKDNGFFFYAAALGLGYLGPDFWLGWRIGQRQKKIRMGLPDVLDLLVICIEAGLSLDQATARTSAELAKAHPALSDELNIVVLEQRAGRPRSECWKNMADRTDVDSLRNLVSVLVQSEQFGTSIAKTLRVHSETLRTQRIQKVEEMAAKTTVKLIFPLVLFIFPSLFLVVLGPAAILMSESFKQLLTH
jgi:tight adherence protein C